jgi:hypothetical protein
LDLSQISLDSVLQRPLFPLINQTSQQGFAALAFGIKPNILRSPISVVNVYAPSNSKTSKRS